MAELGFHDKGKKKKGQSLKDGLAELKKKFSKASEAQNTDSNNKTSGPQ